MLSSGFSLEINIFYSEYIHLQTKTFYCSRNVIFGPQLCGRDLENRLNPKTNTFIINENTPPSTTQQTPISGALRD